MGSITDLSAHEQLRRCGWGRVPWSISSLRQITSSQILPCQSFSTRPVFLAQVTFEFSRSWSHRMTFRSCNALFRLNTCFLGTGTALFLPAVAMGIATRRPANGLFSWPLLLWLSLAILLQHANFAAADCGASFDFPVNEPTFYFQDTINVQYTSNFSAPVLKCWCDPSDPQQRPSPTSPPRPPKPPSSIASIISRGGWNKKY